MEMLRLEETMYSLQPMTRAEIEKINEIKTNETSTTAQIQYMEEKKRTNLPDNKKYVIFTKTWIYKRACWYG